MKYQGDKARNWIMHRIKQDKWCLNNRNSDNEKKGLMLMRIGIYEKILTKFVKCRFN